MKARQFIPFLVIGAGLLAYHNSFTGPFTFDDRDSILENRTIHHLWPIREALSPPRKGGTTVEGRPIINLSLAINYALGGTTVWGYHALNLAIHIFAGLTLLGIVRRTLLRPGLRERFGPAALSLATVVAVIWTVHPLQTESVTYVAQRAESLMGLFYLLTLYCFIRGTESSRSGSWYGLCLVACLLGMTAKEVMVSAPLIVFLYDRTFVEGSFLNAWKRHRRLYIGLASTWLVLGYLVVSTGNRAGTAGFGTSIRWWRYGETQCWAVPHYLWLSVWPHPLVFDYGVWLADAAEIVPSALILAALLTAVAVGFRYRPALGFLGAWFFLILAPSSSVLPVASQTVAEHRVYLSLAAVVVLMTIGAFQLGKTFLSARPQTWTILGWGMSGAVVSLLVILTIQRNRDYRSELIIWEDTAAKCPNNPRAHNNLGDALAGAGRFQEAMGQYEQALRITPDYPEAQNNLAFALFKSGKVPEAMEHFQQALRARPDDAEAHYNLGLALSHLGKPQEAITQFQETLRANPDHVRARNNMGVALIKLGRVQEAIRQYERALKSEPDYHEAQNNLAWLLATLAPADGGDPARAVALARRACQSGNDRVPAHLDTLAVSYAAAGRFNDAITTAHKAIELARNMDQTELAREIEVRLQLYRQGRAYHPSVDGSTASNH